MAEAERTFIGDADAVITVSEEMSRLIAADRGLARPPAVVLNAPETHDLGDSPSLRESLGLGPDVPLMVYSGWVDAERGVGTAIAALPSLPGVHLALGAATRPCPPRWAAPCPWVWPTVCTSRATCRRRT